MRVWIFLTVVIWVANATGMEISTVAQDSAPKYTRGTDGKIQGLCIDIMEAIEAIDPRIHFKMPQQFIPFKRMERDLKLGSIDAFFGFSSSAQRVIDYEFVTIPLYTVKYVLAARIDDPDAIGTLDDLRKLGNDGIVLTLFGTVDAEFLRAQGGLQVDDKASTVTALLAKLDGKRGRYAYYHDLGLMHALRGSALSGKFRVLPFVVRESQHFVAFSKKSDPAKIQAVQWALQKLDDTGRLKAIYKKYSLQ